MAISTRMLHADDHLKRETDVAPPISVTVLAQTPSVSCCPACVCV